MADLEIRERVGESYAAAASRAAEHGGCCGPNRVSTTLRDDEADVFGAKLYGEEGDAVPEASVKASLGCGVPTAVADLHEGETVLDLGCGAGADVLISARRVGPAGKAIGWT